MNSLEPQYKANFPLTDVKNLIASANNGLTFILTENSILVQSPTKGEVFYPLDMIVTNPVLLTCNIDGSVLLLATHFSLYLINFNTRNTVPYQLILEPFTLQNPPGIILDIIFIPYFPTHYLVLYSTGLIQIYDSKTKQLFQTFDSKINARSIRFAQNATDKFVSTSLFALGDNDKIYSYTPFLAPGMKISQKSMWKAENQKEYNYIELMTKEDPNHFFVPPPVRISGDSEIVTAFSINNTRLVFTCNSNDKIQLKSSDISLLLPSFLMTSDKLKFSSTTYGVLQTQPRIMSNPGIFLITETEVFRVFKQKVLRLVYARAILGVGGKKTVCLLNPGFLLPVATHSYGFTRFDPRENDPQIVTETLGQLEASQIEQATKEIEEKHGKLKKEEEEIARVSPNSGKTDGATNLPSRTLTKKKNYDLQKTALLKKAEKLELMGAQVIQRMKAMENVESKADEEYASVLSRISTVLSEIEQKQK